MTMEVENPIEQPTDQLLRKKKVAEALDCSLRHVDRLVARGKLTRVRILGAVRFRLSEVQMLMNGGTT